MPKLKAIDGDEFIRAQRYMGDYHTQYWCPPADRSELQDKFKDAWDWPIIQWCIWEIRNG